MFKVGDIVVWSKRSSYKATHEVCFIQKVNQHTYSLLLLDANEKAIKRTAIKENIFRLAVDAERNNFMDKLNAYQLRMRFYD